MTFLNAAFRRKILNYGALPAIMSLGLALRVFYAIAIQNEVWVDYSLYRLGAEKILEGDIGFTDNLFAVRPPLFPLMVAALGLEPNLVRAANIALGASIIPLAWLLARQLGLEPKLALLVSLIVAIDPPSLRYMAAALQAEPLAGFFLMLAFTTLLAANQASDWRRAVCWGITAGCFIALSAWTRPAAYLLWAPMALWLALSRKRWRALAATALVVPGLMGMAAWQLHNAAVFGNSSFTIVGNYNLLYYRAASALYQASGEEITSIYAELASQVEARLGNDTSDITFEKRLHHLHDPSSRLQSAMTDLALEIFRQYPLQYLRAIPVGVYRLLFWIREMPFWLGISWNGLLLAMAGSGLWHLLRERRFAQAMVLLIPCAYFLAFPLLVNTVDIDTRGRVVFTPLLAVMAAYGVLYLLNRRRTASASPSPPAGN